MLHRPGTRTGAAPTSVGSSSPRRRKPQPTFPSAERAGRGTMGSPGEQHPPPSAPPSGAARPSASVPALILAALAVLFSAWTARGLLLPVLLARFVRPV